jgi:hypothetical protein
MGFLENGDIDIHGALQLRAIFDTARKSRDEAL